MSEIKTGRPFLTMPSRRFDISALRKYGQEMYLASETVGPFATDELTSQVDQSLDEHKFDPRVDYFAMTGPHTQVAIAFGLLLARYGRVRALVFDAATEAYAVRIVETSAFARSHA